MTMTTENGRVQSTRRPRAAARAGSEGSGTAARITTPPAQLPNSSV
jgi:hypothetical protein